MAEGLTFNDIVGPRDLMNLAGSKKLASRFGKLGATFTDALGKLSPEFGAYMSYSIYQELGTHKIAARPHIVPAVENTARDVLEEVAESALDLASKMFASSSGVSNRFIEKEMANAWLRALNGPTRQEAIKLATNLGVVEFGFHRRSIHGYAYEREDSEIEQAQEEAEANRKSRRKTKKKKS